MLGTRAGFEADRAELKFWIPEHRTADVLRFVEPHLVRDEHLDPGATLGQCHTSLYLDTDAWSFYRNHVEGAPDRYKLRIRAYGDPPRGVSFFEVKRKIKDVSVKRRAVVPLDLAEPLIDGTYDGLPLDSSRSADERRALEGFLYLAAVSRAQPRVLVRSRREAYASPDGGEDVRVTIDRRICCQPARGPSLESDPDAWTYIDGYAQHGERGPHALVEVKFPSAAPRWVQRLIARMERPRIAYSKYVSAVDALYQTARLDLRYSSARDGYHLRAASVAASARGR